MPLQSVVVTSAAVQKTGLSKVGTIVQADKVVRAKSLKARPRSGIRFINDATRDAFTAARRACEALKMLKVVVFQIGECSADLHTDLANMCLKLKFVVNGSTHLKSKAGKASTGMDQQLRINFDKMGGAAIYEGGEMLHFELCGTRLCRSSRILARCAVPAMTVLQSIFNDPKQKLNLDLISLDTPGKVLAKLAVKIAFRISTLDHVGGLQILKTPSLKLPAQPKPKSESMTTREYDAITSFCNHASKVAQKLTASHDASIKAISRCRQDAFRETVDATSMNIASRLQVAPHPSTLVVATADSVSTSCGNLSAEESLGERWTTAESVKMAGMLHSNQPIQVSLPRPIDFQSDQLESASANMYFVAATHKVEL